MTTSEDIRCALRLRYPPVQHALLWEVAPSTGGGTRYADAVAVGLWASHGHAIEGIEIKVSRGDFLAEMKQPEKSEPVMRFCNRWWLAAPKGLVSPDELPTTWGLLELCGDVMRVKVKAPKLEPAHPTLPFIASLMRRTAGPSEAMAAAALLKSEREIRTRCEEEANRRVEGRIAQRVGHAEAAEKRLADVLEATGIDFGDYNVDKVIIQAVKQYRAIAGDWDHNLSELREGAAKLVQALDAMESKA